MLSLSYRAPTILVHLCVLTGCLILACGRPAIGQTGSSSAEHLVLPADYRMRIAREMVVDYLGATTGPATISSVRYWDGLFGGKGATVMVRYPVKGQSFLGVRGEDVTRCVTVEFTPRDEGINMRMSRSRRDGELCGGYEQTTPFVELTRFRNKVLACRTKGERNCLLETTLPEAKARKLMNQR